MRFEMKKWIISNNLGDKVISYKPNFAYNSIKVTCHGHSTSGCCFVTPHHIVGSKIQNKRKMHMCDWDMSGIYGLHLQPCPL